MTDCSCEEKCKDVEDKGTTLIVQGEYIVIERDKPEEGERKSPGGIVLTGVEPPPHTATVIGVGPKVDGIEVGDRVIVGMFVGILFEHNGDDLCAIIVNDVIAIV